MVNSLKLEGTSIYNNKPIYINNSFCKEYSRYGYYCRRLKNSSLIEGYKVKNGVFQIKPLGSEEFVEISHVSDFLKYNLIVEDL